MKRRHFLAGLLAVPAVTYFDMGSAWKKHNGLYLRGVELVGDPCAPTDGLFLIEDAGPLLKAYYNDKVVHGLTFDTSELWRNGARPKVIVGHPSLIEKLL